MRNVDCEYLIQESHNCCNKKIAKGFIGKLWAPTCIEMKITHVDCHYRESIWDMLKKQNPQNNTGSNSPPGSIPNHRPPPPPCPPPPPAPPPKRVICEDVKLKPLTEGKWRR